MTTERRREPLEHRFWRHVDKRGPDECWQWTAGASNRGYGGMSRRIGPGRWSRQLAHRLSWEFHFASPPGEKLVCHRCDNRLCVNPAHLFLGTNADNMADAKHKGRIRSGEHHGLAKLTAEQVREIRRARSESTVSQRELGLRFGVSESQVSRIVRRTDWKFTNNDTAETAEQHADRIIK